MTLFLLRRGAAPAWAATLAVALAAAPVAPPGPDTTWAPGTPSEVYVAPGRATTVLLRSPQKVAAISLASPIIAYKYDKALNQLEITPTVRAGGLETNLNLRIGREVYVLLVKVVTDARAQALRSFALAADSGADDEVALGQARALNPQELDLVGAAKTLEQAEIDPVFAQAHPDLRVEHLGRLYSWNDCLVSLGEEAQFAGLDLLVFRVRWLNRTNDALYLEATQYGLTVAGRPIPITARYQAGGGAVVYPGQSQTVYLAVQGYRLSRHNDWQLSLPPDGAAVARAISR